MTGFLASCRQKSFTVNDDGDDDDDDDIFCFYSCCFITSTITRLSYTILGFDLIMWLVVNF